MCTCTLSKIERVCHDRCKHSKKATLVYLTPKSQAHHVKRMATFALDYYIFEEQMHEQPSHHVLRVTVMSYMFDSDT